MQDPLVVGVVLGAAIILLLMPPIKTYPPVPKKMAGSYDIYVINLDGAEQRLEHFKRQFAASDISADGKTSFIRFPAIAGRTLDLQSMVSDVAHKEILEAERTGFRLRHYMLSRGAVGCYLSHLRLWHAMLETDKDTFLVFEDDAQVHPKLGNFLKTTPVPADFDIILLGFVCFKCSKDEAAGFHRVRRFFGLHGYLISRKGIRAILANRDALTPVRKQIDTVLSDLAQDGKIVVYASTRKWVEQNNEDFPTQIQIPIKEGVDPWAALEHVDGSMGGLKQA